jgi:hypothetical protein
MTTPVASTISTQSREDAVVLDVSGIAWFLSGAPSVWTEATPANYSAPLISAVSTGPGILAVDTANACWYFTVAAGWVALASSTYVRGTF